MEASMKGYESWWTTVFFPLILPAIIFFLVIFM